MLVNSRRRGESVRIHEPLLAFFLIWEKKTLIFRKQGNVGGTGKGSCARFLPLIVIEHFFCGMRNVAYSPLSVCSCYVFAPGFRERCMGGGWRTENGTASVFPITRCGIKPRIDEYQNRVIFRGERTIIRSGSDGGSVKRAMIRWQSEIGDYVTKRDAETITNVTGVTIAPPEMKKKKKQKVFREQNQQG